MISKDALKYYKSLRWKYKLYKNKLLFRLRKPSNSSPCKQIQKLRAHMQKLWFYLMPLRNVTESLLPMPWLNWSVKIKSITTTLVLHLGSFSTSDILRGAWQKVYMKGNKLYKLICAGWNLIFSEAHKWKSTPSVQQKKCKGMLKNKNITYIACCWDAIWAAVQYIWVARALGRKEQPTITLFDH